MGILYIPRPFAIFGLPHSDPAKAKGDTGLPAPFAPDARYWVRRDGGGVDASWKVRRSWLTVFPSGHGLPYGKWATLLIIMLATKARETGSRTVRLGSINETLGAMGIRSASGGETGNIGPLKESVHRLLGSEFTYLPHESDDELDAHTEDDGYLLPSPSRYVTALREGREAWLKEWVEAAKAGFRIGSLPDDKAVRFRITDAAKVWSEHCRDAEVTLSETFFRMATEDEVALDEQTVRGIQNSAIALDAYTFLNARVRWIRRASELSPLLLAHQLGTVSPSREFRRRFKEAVGKIVEAGWADLDVRFRDGTFSLDFAGGRTKAGKVALHATSTKEGLITILTCEPHVKSISMRKAADEVIKGDESGQALGQQIVGDLARKAAAATGSKHDRPLAEARTATPESWMKRKAVLDDFGR